MSLFGFLATKFASSPENLATEALNYVVGRSRVATRALLRLLAEGGAMLPADIAFQTQVGGGDQARPDIEGRSAKRGTVVVIEAKFWAGLTANQPVAYLGRLPEEAPAVLAFVAPAARFTTLWPELVGRCQAAGHGVGPTSEATAELWTASLPKGRTLMLLSWRTVLAEVIRVLENEGEADIAADARQLAGLCDQMDTEAFLPLRSEEVTSVEIPRRHVQFAQLALEAGEKAIATGLCSTKGGLRQGTGLGYCGRYLRLGDTLVFLTFDCARWARFRSTPLWLRIDGDQQVPREAARQALGKLRLENPPRLIEDDGYPWVPLSVPIGREWPGVVAAVVDQLAEVAGHLQSHLPDLGET
ncbi:hypothetical protein [Magnetospirillum sp. 15-1]|uniref:hypothetical protein n=1 Tax=Magnetospirillum sp. 15-1 TaxID=1979370 RepID=UPI0011429D9C|nr:hypothetical protein [Magnetospirillum sp. 15-1]